ncbi:hypothetical protein EDD86DRAFT_53779 [Gorgonomyces haynaldii]|nr:hypothetical protein EDD86DRAFT_53779 [Gorgonomyces haynaldii]
MTFTATIPQLPADAERVPLDLLVGLLSIDWDHSLEKPPRVNPKESNKMLQHLAQELNQMKKKEPNVHEIQEFARKTWSINAAAEKRLHQLEFEKKQIERNRDRVWKQFDQILLPLWGFDESLMPVHDQLASIYKQLVEIRDAPLSTMKIQDREAKILNLQKQLHEIESKTENGKFGDAKQVPRGQAMCMSLLNRCYKLVHEIVVELPELDDSLLQTYIKLKEANVQLRSMLEMVYDGIDIFPLHLREIQDQVNAIESTLKDGKFTDEQGNVPQGQAMLHEQLEQAYDSIHLLLEYQEQPGEQEWSKDMRELVQARNNLWALATDTFSAVSETAYEALIAPLNTSVDIVKSTVKKGNRLAKGYAASAISYARKLALSLEEVDPLLQPSQKELELILQRLYAIRNLRNRQVLVKIINETPNDPIVYEDAVLLNGLYDELKQAEKEIPKVIELPGERVIKHLVDECYAVLLPMMDDHISAH